LTMSYATFVLSLSVVTLVSPFLVEGTTSADPLIRKQLSCPCVTECVAHIKTILESKGFRIFATVDHSDNAASVGLTLRPTSLVMFGNPNVGTKLMQCAPEYAIDLPQKVLVYEDDLGIKWAAINSQVFLAEKHRATKCQDLVNKVNGKLTALLNSF